MRRVIFYFKRMMCICVSCSYASIFDAKTSQKPSTRITGVGHFLCQSYTRMFVFSYEVGGSLYLFL